MPGAVLISQQTSWLMKVFRSQNPVRRIPSAGKIVDCGRLKYSRTRSFHIEALGSQASGTSHSLMPERQGSIQTALSHSFFPPSVYILRARPQRLRRIVYCQSSPLLSSRITSASTIETCSHEVGEWGNRGAKSNLECASVPSIDIVDHHRAGDCRISHTILRAIPGHSPPTPWLSSVRFPSLSFLSVHLHSTTQQQHHAKIKSLLS